MDGPCTAPCQFHLLPSHPFTPSLNALPPPHPCRGVSLDFIAEGGAERRLLEQEFLLTIKSPANDAAVTLDLSTIAKDAFIRERTDPSDEFPDGSNVECPVGVLYLPGGPILDRRKLLQAESGGMLLSFIVNNTFHDILDKHTEVYPTGRDFTGGFSPNILYNLLDNANPQSELYALAQRLQNADLNSPYSVEGGTLLAIPDGAFKAFFAEQRLDFMQLTLDQQDTLARGLKNHFLSSSNSFFRRKRSLLMFSSETFPYNNDATTLLALFQGQSSQAVILDG